MCIRDREVFAGIDLRTYNDLVKLEFDEAVQVDIEVLRKALKAADEQIEGHHSSLKQLNSLADALKKCRGTFLEGHQSYWALAQRENIAACRVQAQTLLMRQHAKTAHYEAALTYGREILEDDPFREATQREVMWLYLLNSQRARAIGQYNKLKALLRTELAIAPMPETTALYEHILHLDTEPLKEIAYQFHVGSGTQTTISMLEALEQSRLTVMHALAR